MITDIFLVIPAFPLIVVIAAYSKNGGDPILIAVLVVTGWSYGARQLRVQALSLRHRDFLVAARLRGERRWRVIVSEILPTMTSLIVAIFLGTTLYAIVAAAGLQFIGLGNPNTLSWGTMLYWAQNNEALQAGSPLWAIMPGICIALLGAAFALIELRLRRDQQPGSAPGAKEAPVKPLDCSYRFAAGDPAAGESARPDELAGNSQEVDKKLILEVAELSVDYAGAASATAVDKVSFAAVRRRVHGRRG